MTTPQFVPESATRVVLSVNPKAGATSSATLVNEVMDQLTRRGLQPEASTSLDHVAARATELFHAGELRALVAVGGDGTVAELVNRTEPGLPLALLPTGNENLLARYVGVERSANSVCKAIHGGRLLQLDAARANGRVFLLMLGCGFDGAVVAKVHARRTGHIRSRDYFKPIWEVVRSYAYPEIRLTSAADVPAGVPGAKAPPDAFGAVDAGGVGETPAAGPSVAPPPGLRGSVAGAWLFAFNLPCYGGGLQIAPLASGRDGLLDVCTFTGKSMWRGLLYGAAVYCRMHQWLPDYEMQKVRRFTLAADAEVHYQLDGDPGGTLPVEVESLPRRLTLLVPESRAEAIERAFAGPTGKQS